MATANPVLQYAMQTIANKEHDEETIKSELYAVTRARESLFGVEQVERGKLDLQAHRLRKDLKMLDSGYTRLSKEPLSWTTREGGILRPQRPVFAVYNLHSPYMMIRSEDAVRNNRGHWLTNDMNGMPSYLPSGLEDLYRPHQERLRGSTRITTFFQGVIPKEAREAINKSRPFFTEEWDAKTQTGVQDNIFLIGEAKWVEGVEPSPPRTWNLEPLVVGWDGEDMWLITSFDLTSLEKYVEQEFPALPGHTDDMVLPEHK